MKANKMLSRRDFLRVSAVAVAGAGLTACVAPTTQPAVGVAGTPQVVKETVEVVKEVPAQGPTTIRFSVWYGQGDIEVWDTVLNAFEKANPNIKRAFEPLAWTQYWQKLQVGLAAGDPPDVIGMGIGVVYDYIGRKQLISLNPYLDRDGVKREQWFPGLLQEAVWPKPGNDLYALPYRFTGSAFFINKTLFDKAGVKYPEKGWTWPDDYLNLAKTLTDSKNDQWGTLVAQNQLIEPFLATNQTGALTSDLKKSNFLDPKVEEVFQFEADLICKYQYAPKAADLQGVGDLFLSGKVAMLPGAQWDIAAYRKITDFQWDVVYNPLKSGVNKEGTYGGPDMLSIPKGSKHPEEAWKLVLFATGSSEAQKLMSATAVPTLIAEASSPDFVAAQEKLGPASYHIVVEQAKSAVGFSFSPAWNEWTNAYSQAMTEVYNCNTPLKDALTKIDGDVNNILSQAWQALEG